MGPCMDPGKGPDRVLCTDLGRDRDTDLDKGHGKDPGQQVGEPHMGLLAVQRTEVEGLLEAADIQEAGMRVEAGCTRAVPAVEALHLPHELGSQEEPRKLEEVDSHGDTWQTVPPPLTIAHISCPLRCHAFLCFCSGSCNQYNRREAELQRV